MLNSECMMSMESQKENAAEYKSFEFAVRIVNLSRHLRQAQKEYVLSKQLLRCGTSIGANISEAQRAQTRADFHSKMCISLKEANETYYWLRLLYRTGYLTQKEYISMEKDIEELLRIITAVCKSTASH